MRVTPLTESEKTGFINRQLVETSQSAKAVATLLREMYPETEIVYVKAHLVSEFRKEFELLKSRSVNDLHHAKDAYLNIVVGNVYHSRFSKRWFCADQNYSIKQQILFSREIKLGNDVIWRGKEDIAAVKNTMQKNSVHFTRYAFCRKGGFFDQMPLKAKEGLIPRKADLPTEKYGGYNKPTASFFVLVKYRQKKGWDAMIMAVELMHSKRFLADDEFAKAYAQKTVSQISGKQAEEVSFPLGKRILKVNTLLSIDGFYACIGSKSSGGAEIGLIPMTPLITGEKNEKYIKKLDSFLEKKKKNPRLIPDEKHDKITKEQNEALYALLKDKLEKKPFSVLLGAQQQTLKNGQEKFKELSVEAQAKTLLEITALFKTGRTGGCNLKDIGGAEKAGVLTCSSKLSNLKNYGDIRIIDTTSSGLFSKVSQNILELI